MKKKLLIDLLIIILLNVLVKPVAIFGIDAAVQNRIGSDAYGLYFSLLNLSYLFNILMDLGINNYTTKNVAQYPHIIPGYMGKIIGLRLLLFIGYALITFTIGFIIGYRGNALLILSILVFNQLLSTFILYIRSHLGGLHLFRTDAVISVLDKLLLIAMCGFLLYISRGNSFRIEWLIWSQTIAYALTLIIALSLLIAKIGVPKISIKRAFSIAIIRQSLPYALLVLLMMLYTRTDSIMIERIHPDGAHEAGVYAKGFRLLDTLFMFGMLFSTMLFPVFSRMIKEKSKDTSILIESARDLLIGGAVVLALISTHLAPLILGWIYKENNYSAAPSFILLMWSFVAMAATLIYGTVLTAKGDLRYLNIISAIGISINVTLNFILIPKFGATGAACSTLCTQSLTAILQIVRVHHYMPPSQPLFTVGKFSGIAIAMILLTNFLPLAMWAFILECLIGLGLLFIFKLIDLEQLRQVIREKL